MRTLAEIWPPSGLEVSEGDLRLTVISDDDVPGLVELALSGVHEPGEMPFSVPWTEADPATLPANMYRYFSHVRATFTPEKFDLLFAVRVAGQLVGAQALHTRDFALTRTGETGSWLARRAQGSGIGTRMRRAVCALAFDALAATEITSAAFVDNGASLAVSRKVGYQPNGFVRLKRRAGEVALNQKLVLTPQTFVRGAPITVYGLDPLKQFLGLG